MKRLCFALFILQTLFAKAETRIVSLNPALTEILFKMGLGDKIVGTTTFSNYPVEAQSIPLVGSYFKPNIEKIIQLSPSHVLAYKEGDPSILKFLEKSKLKYSVFNSRTDEDYFQTLLTLGDLFSKKVEAQQLIQDWNRNLQKLAGNQKFKGFIQVDYNPLMAAGSDTFLSRALQRCGFENIFSFSGYKKVGREAVSAARPEKIIILGQLNSQTTFAEVKRSWVENPLTHKAQIVQADADTLSRLGPRFPESLRKLCQGLQ